MFFYKVLGTYLYCFYFGVGSIVIILYVSRPSLLKVYSSQWFLFRILLYLLTEAVVLLYQFPIKHLNFITYSINCLDGISVLFLL